MQFKLEMYQFVEILKGLKHSPSLNILFAYYATYYETYYLQFIFSPYICLFIVLLNKPFIK